MEILEALGEYCYTVLSESSKLTVTHCRKYQKLTDFLKTILGASLTVKTKLSNKIVQFKYIPTGNNRADMFTKPLARIIQFPQKPNNGENNRRRNHSESQLSERSRAL